MLFFSCGRPFWGWIPPFWGVKARILAAKKPLWTEINPFSGRKAPFCSSKGHFGAKIHLLGTEKCHFREQSSSCAEENLHFGAGKHFWGQKDLF